ncbi:protein HEAT INTOLERANT 4-like [Rosa rugosa]|uniref:protein HEAT INTOLERANT 4-like n=1 Tax=Rosa rugosa TaxID=74645 RepID=UPI002B409955|nr:protein HEAT INTOLERANT 4-like [Rosa rugosa]
MRKGAKRKARPAAATEEAAIKPKATATRAKRVKASQPQPEPEYVEEQRNLQDLWKAAFPVGTEWDRLESIYQYDWDFSNLEKEFEEEGGKFHGIGNNKVYLFGQTETSSPSQPVLIPTLVAVVAPRPPSMEIGIRSVQREDKEIVPMRQMKMDWIPYIPLEQREGWNSERAKKFGSNLPQIFVLGCTQRKAGLKQMKEERWMKFQYCMPYLMNPNEEEKEQSTVMDILFPREPQAPLFVQFDWEFDEVEEYTDELIKAEELSEDKKEAFMEFVREEVKKAKKKIREEREAKKKLMEDPKYQEAKMYYENMRLYKIYPVQTPNTPVIEMKSKYINYYYGSAHEII